MTLSVDGGAPISVDSDNACRENLNMNWPGIDIRFLGWVKVPDVSLTAGAHSLTWSVGHHPDISGDQSHGMIDAFHVTNQSWGPAGAMSPAQMPAEYGPEDWTVWAPGDPPEDPSDSVFDLSRLIEAPAGERGPLVRDGAGFAFADDTPVKFWGMGSTYPGSPELAEQQAKMYRMYGINMVRLHPVQSMLGVLDASGQLNPDGLDKLDRWFAALKAQGVYSTWSLFYPHVVTEHDNVPADVWSELSPRGAGRSSSGFTMIVGELEAAQEAWASALLNHVNPYTGLKYADDPALAVVEAQNEDNLFWHHPLNVLSDGSSPNLQARLQQLWMLWLQDRYGTTEALRAAWGAGARGDDAIDNPTMEVYGAWEMAAENPFDGYDARARMGDYIRFLAELQRDFFERRKSFLREQGFDGVFVTTGWKVGGPAADAANLWSDAVGDAIDRHNYAGGGAGGHGIGLGVVNNYTHLAAPGEGLLSWFGQQVEDRPMIYTEWTMSGPAWWRGEMAPLFAAYGMGLHGWDGSYHFSGGKPWMRSGWPNQSSYVTETPLYMGQFPALARLVHEGHVTTSELAAARRLPEDLAFAGYDALTQPTGTSGWNPDEGEDSFVLPEGAFAVGRITTKVGDEQDAPVQADWANYIDANSGVIQSLTGELTWDTTNRTVLIDTAKTQAVVGFAKSKTVELKDYTLALDSDFASLLVTALDGQELSESGRVLITALARDIQTGAKYNADGTQLEAMGGPPLLLEPVLATLTFRTGTIHRVEVLDAYGVPTGVEVPLNEDGSVRIDGRYGSFNYLLEVDGVDRDTGIFYDDDFTDDGKDCGCQSAPTAWLAWWMLPMIWGVRRRDGRKT